MNVFLKRIVGEALIILIIAFIIDFILNGFSRRFIHYYFYYTLIVSLFIILGFIFSSFYPVTDLARKSVIAPELAGRSGDSMRSGHGEFSSLFIILTGVFIACLIAYIVSYIH
jgi:hypothetical protein